VEVVAQSERAIIWYRACDIVPGQNAAAAALAREFIELANEKSAVGQSTAFQSITAPFNQIQFMSFVPDLGTWQSQTDALLADERYQALVQKAQGVIDVNSCVDSLSRIVP
jgi:hypothetical protein